MKFRVSSGETLTSSQGSHWRKYARSRSTTAKTASACRSSSNRISNPSSSIKLNTVLLLSPGDAIGHINFRLTKGVRVWRHAHDHESQRVVDESKAVLALRRSILRCSC